MSTRTLLTPGTLSPRRRGPGAHPAAGVRGQGRAHPQRGPVGAATGDHRGHAGRRPDRGAGAAGRRRGRRSRGDHGRGGPGGPRVPRRPRRVPVDAGLPRLPEVVLHEPERGHLPRHPRLHRDPGRRHRQHRRHRVHRRRPRRHQRHLHRRRRRRRRTGCWSSAPTRRPCARSRRSGRAGRSTSSGRVIESYARRFGYGVVRDFTGHGIGRDFHSGLVVLHYDDPAVHDRCSRRG